MNLSRERTVLKLTNHSANYWNAAWLGAPVDINIDIDLLPTRFSQSSICITAWQAGWASPFFWPGECPVSLQRLRSSCGEASWIMVDHAHRLVEAVSSNDFASLLIDSDILRMANDSNLSTDKSPPRSKLSAYYRYECCRLTLILMTRVCCGSMSWCEAASRTPYAESIVHALSHSDLTDLWDAQVGLLFWVTSIAWAILFNTENRLYISGIAVRVLTALTWSDNDPRVGVQIMSAMAKFEERCRNSGVRQNLSTSGA